MISIIKNNNVLTKSIINYAFSDFKDKKIKEKTHKIALAAIILTPGLGLAMIASCLFLDITRSLYTDETKQPNNSSDAPDQDSQAQSAIKTSTKIKFMSVGLDGDKEGRVIIRNPQRKDDMYAAYINSLGEVYIDCSEKKLLAKHFVFIFDRASHGILKFLSIPVEIILDIKRTDSASEWGKKLFNHLCDIIRVPLFTLAIVVTHIVGFVIGSIYSPALYVAREIAGKIELQMFRVARARDVNSLYYKKINKEIESNPDKYKNDNKQKSQLYKKLLHKKLSYLKPLIKFEIKCFTPLLEVNKFETIKEKENALQNFASEQIDFLMKHIQFPFHCFKHDENKPYISPYLQQSDINNISQFEGLQQWACA